MMSLSAAPAVISRYFELDGTPERETHQGRAAIRAWRLGPASRFAYTTEILGTESDGPDRHVVTARLTGNFPGSTVVLRHDFTLAGERIARLVIAP